MLSARDLFHHSSDDKSNYTCPVSSIPDPPQVPVFKDFSFHQVIIAISAICLGISCLVSFYLILRHATHYSIPQEQKQIIRIIFMIPIFSFISFFSVALYDAEIYFRPIPTLYESFALASFFLLICAFIHGNDEERQAAISSAGAMSHNKAATIGAFQFPVVSLILLVVTEITEATGRYCATSNKLRFAHIWVTIINLISTTIAILAILKFYKVMKPVINHRKPLPKLLAFKGIVFINFIQTTIFSFLRSSNDLKPTEHYTFHDLTVGVPNLLLSIEMLLFSLAFLYVYRTRPYFFKTGATAVPLGNGGYHGGFLGIKALLEALNILDILEGILSIPKMLSGGNDGYGNSSMTRRWGSSEPQQYESIEMLAEARHGDRQSLYRGQM